MITNIDQLDISKTYTYKDYYSWRFEDRVELIHGKIHRLPTGNPTRHQEVLGKLGFHLYEYAKQKNYDLFHMPLDVRLPFHPNLKADDEIDTVVQPDLFMVCDVSKMEERGCLGAPDWIVEVLSYGSATKDLNEKFFAYEKAGVKAYWVIHPYEGTVLVYIADNAGKFQLMRQRPFTENEKITMPFFPDLEINLSVVFDGGDFWHRKH